MTAERAFRYLASPKRQRFNLRMDPAERTIDLSIDCSEAHRLSAREAHELAVMLLERVGWFLPSDFDRS